MRLFVTATSDAPRVVVAAEHFLERLAEVEASLTHRSSRILYLGGRAGRRSLADAEVIRFILIPQVGREERVFKRSQGQSSIVGLLRAPSYGAS